MAYLSKGMEWKRDIIINWHHDDTASTVSRELKGEIKEKVSGVRG